MPSITIRELSRNTAGVIDDVQKSRRPALVTRNGKFVAAVVPIDEDELEDWILSNAPEFVESMEEANRDLKEGRAVSLASLLDELDPE
jgi:prevent-host-death family protein